jgi:enoyl-CoA hydratase/carnithine racemase
VVDKALELAEKIADQSPLIVQMAKEAVNASFETSLAHGLQFERRLFHATFATVCYFKHHFSLYSTSFV